MKLWIYRFAGLWLAAAGLAASAQEPEPAPQMPPEMAPELWQTLLAADRVAAEMKGFRARFTQEKHTALLRRPLVSSGEVAAVDGIVLWQTREPAPSALRVDGQEMRVVYPQEKLVEVYPLDGRWAELVASPVPRLASLAERFRIEPLTGEAVPSAHRSSPGRVALRLTPREEDLARFVSRVDLGLVPEQGFAEWVEILDPDGERTVITFTDASTGVGPEAVTLTIEPGTEIRHPLGG